MEWRRRSDHLWVKRKDDIVARGHRVGRVVSFFSSRRNWDIPNPSPAGEFAPPPRFWGKGLTRWRERDWESPNSDEGTYTVILFRYTYFVLVGHKKRFAILPPFAKRPGPWNSGSLLICGKSEWSLYVTLVHGNTLFLYRALLKKIGDLLKLLNNSRIVFIYLTRNYVQCRECDFSVWSTMLMWNEKTDAFDPTTWNSVWNHIYLEWYCISKRSIIFPKYPIELHIQYVSCCTVDTGVINKKYCELRLLKDLPIMARRTVFVRRVE